MIQEKKATQNLESTIPLCKERNTLIIMNCSGKLVPRAVPDSEAFSKC